MDSNEKNGLRVAASNTQQEIDRKFELSNATHSTLALIANLLRVVRGAGKPHEIVGQAAQLVEDYDRYFESQKRYPGDEVASEICNSLWEDRDRSSNRDFAVDKVVRGSLQITASRILGQGLQIQAGERELREGIKDLEVLKASKRLDNLRRGS